MVGYYKIITFFNFTNNFTNNSENKSNEDSSRTNKIYPNDNKLENEENKGQQITVFATDGLGE